MEKVFILRWYGPFLFEQLRTWEISQKNTFNLYLIGGKKNYSKKQIHEIWVGTIINKKATHKDVLLVEKMLTSYFVAEGELLNVINKKLPEESLYLINEWIHYKRNSECLRLPKISIGNMMPDVIIYKKDNYSDEYKLFVSNKLKITD